jgi:formylglycine-generating enzyme required for sulfatase activity
MRFRPFVLALVTWLLPALFFLPFRAEAGESVFTNKLGMRFILIPKGSFLMGSPESETGRNRSETPHRVTISRNFFLMESEVTQGQWEKLVGFNPSAFPECGKTCPVDTVSWDQCMEFIRVLNDWEKTTRYRLPTEAEWEYACRAGSATAFAGGPITQTFCKIKDPVLDAMGWYCGNSGYLNPPDGLRPHPSKTKKPNAWGLYDMHGNVQEWCLDACNWREPFGTNRIGPYTGTYVDGIKDPLEKEGDHRIIRGGAWFQSAQYCRSGWRGFYKPVTKRNSLGFRILREE